MPTKTQTRQRLTVQQRQDRAIRRDTWQRLQVRAAIERKLSLPLFSSLP